MDEFSTSMRNGFGGDISLISTSQGWWFQAPVIGIPRKKGDFIGKCGLNDQLINFIDLNYHLTVH